MRSVDGFFENLSLMKFSKIFVMKTTNNGLFVHQLKKQLKLVIFVRKPHLREQKWTTPLLWKIVNCEKLNFYGRLKGKFISELVVSEHASASRTILMQENPKENESNCQLTNGHFTTQLVRE